MIIQLNTDKNIQGDARLESYLSSLIKDELSYYSDHITRVEIYLADENGNKKGVNDKRCTLEARLEKRQPVVVTCHADTVEKAMSEAIDKLKSSIVTITDRLKQH